jgi:hypothetical protein
VLIVAPRSLSVQCGGGKCTKPLSRCFEEVGFRAYETPGLTGLARHLASISPHLLAVDVQTDAHAVSKVERVLRRKGPWSTTPVIYYNVEGVPGTAARPAVGLLRSAWNFGTRMTDRELFEVIAPLVNDRGSEGRPGTTTMQAAVDALQGRIIDDSLQEVLSFMEIGRKNGCLLVETNCPYGMIYFDQGLIISAATKSSTGMEAVLDMLKIRRGVFRFAPDKKPEKADSGLPVSAVLLEFSKRVDEAAQQPGPVGFSVAANESGARVGD